MEDFATYILEEENLSQKMLITYYLSKKTGIFFDKSIVLKTEIAKMFIEYMQINVDKNLVLTAMLLCNCKKIENAQKIGKLETFAKDGAEYLSTLGFSKRFCKICEEVNRYSESSPRERESDILEIVDQFTGLILNRVERDAFSTEEALVVLKERNLKYADNRYMEMFTEFIKAIEENIKKKAKRVLAKEPNEVQNMKSDLEKMKELASATKKQSRALFSDDTTQKVLNHKSKYKVEE